MAFSVLRSKKSRDGLAATLLANVGDLEEAMYGMQSEFQATLDGIDALVEGAQANSDNTESMLTDLEALLDSVNISSLARLNRPNLLKQNFVTTRNMPTSVVIVDEHSIAAEDATAAAETITYTITDENITASMGLFQCISNDYTNIPSSLISVSCAAGVATVTIGARSAHAATSVKVWICTYANAEVPYGSATRISGSAYPYLRSIKQGDYPGDDSVDGIYCTIATLTGNDIITEPDEETYTKAIQYAITANSAWGNAEYLLYFYPNSSNWYYQGNTPRDYGQIAEMTPGKKYTMSCWVRVLSGDGVWLKMGYGNSYSNDPYNDNTNHRSGVSDVIKVDANGGVWQRVSWTFEFNPSGDWYAETSEQVTVNNETKTKITRTYNWFKKVGFGVCRKYTATVQICGFRLVEGGLYLPTKYDELMERLDALEASIATTAEAEAIISEYTPGGGS